MSEKLIALWPLGLLLFAVVIVGAVVALAQWRGKKQRTEKERLFEGQLAKDRALLTEAGIDTTESLDAEQPALRLGELLADLHRGDARVVVSTVNMASICFGPTGSGKTTLLYIENIIAWPSDSFAFVSTLKSDLAESTILARESFGGRAAVFDPGDLIKTMKAGSAGERAFDTVEARLGTWTPVIACTDWPHAVDVAGALIAGADTSSAKQSNAGFWETQVQVLLATAMLLQRLEGPSPEYPGTLRGAHQWINDLKKRAAADEDPDEEVIALASADLQDLIQKHSILAKSSDKSLQARGKNAEAAYESALEMLTSVEETMTASDTAAGIIGNVTTVMLAFSRVPVVYRAAWNDQNVINIRKYVRNLGGTIYSIARTPDVRPVITAFVGAVVDELERFANEHRRQQLPTPALLALDELTNSTPHPKLDLWLSATFRQARIKALLAMQDRAQLIAEYGEHKEKVIEDNTHEMILLGGSKDAALYEWASKVAGKEEVFIETRTVTKSTTKNYKHFGSLMASSRNESVSEALGDQRIERQLVSEARLFSMPEQHALVLIPRRGAAHVALTPSYKDDAVLAACAGDRNAIQHVQRRINRTGWESPEVL